MKNYQNLEQSEMQKDLEKQKKLTKEKEQLCEKKRMLSEKESPPLANTTLTSKDLKKKETKPQEFSEWKEEKKEGIIKKKLKPVIFEDGIYNYHRNNLFKQNILLRAMQQTSNVIQLKRLTGMKTVAEVYRTLDKMAIRKEYHLALERNGIDLDTIIAGIKNLAVNSNSDRVKLSGWVTLLKSLGLDEYKDDISTIGKSWEEKMKDLAQKETDNQNLRITDGDNNVKKIDDYEVIAPRVPQKEIDIENAEANAGASLYE